MTNQKNAKDFILQKFYETHKEYYAGFDDFKTHYESGLVTCEVRLILKYLQEYDLQNKNTITDVIREKHFEAEFDAANKEISYLQEVKEELEDDLNKYHVGWKNKLIEWTEWLGEMGWYKEKGKDKWCHDDETGCFESTKDLVEHYNHNFWPIKGAQKERNKWKELCEKLLKEMDAAEWQSPMQEEARELLRPVDTDWRYNEGIVPDESGNYKAAALKERLHQLIEMYLPDGEAILIHKIHEELNIQHKKIKVKTA